MLSSAARARLRAARAAAGLSLRELSLRVGVSASQLSQIENGKSDPSVSSLYALATELRISLDTLLGGPQEDDDSPPISLDLDNDGSSGLLASVVHGSPIVRANHRRTLEMDSGVTWEQLCISPNIDVDSLLVTYQPGGSSSSSGMSMTHPGIEFAYLMEGELTLELGFTTHVIHEHDSLVFQSSRPHLYRNDGDIPARGVWFVLGANQGPRSKGMDEGGVVHSFKSAVDVLNALR
jgi:transcriptional regulator with XRE-family HTH domain/quercetin dioxygenase-like cupin family protein